MAINPNTTFTAGAILTAAQMNRLPWGVMGVASATANQTGISTVTDITGLSVTFTANSSRMYKTTVFLPYAEQQTAASYPAIYITDSANAIKQQNLAYHVVGYGEAKVVIIYESGLSGSTVRKARATTSAGSLTIVASATSPTLIMVEDIGAA